MSGKNFKRKKSESAQQTVPQAKQKLVGPPLDGGATANAAGVSGFSSFPNQAALLADHSAGGDGVLAVGDKTGVGIHARGGRLAGLFEGSVEVKGRINTTNLNVEGDIAVQGNIDLTGPTSDISLRNEDCAEQFNACEGHLNQPGTVMVIDDEGLLRPSRSAYDKRVAGVISGAGNFRPALTLGVTHSVHKRVPIALLGKVYCWADADSKPIEVGDLLTSSSVEGHAMAASEPARAFGAIIGKALQPLASGRGLIPILVALQ